jgi:hypothetical protein
MAKSIIYPNQTTYFICYNADRVDVMAYGSVEPTQQMETGQPILDTYLDEVEWLEVLKERGIDINTQIQEEL